MWILSLHEIAAVSDVGRRSTMMPGRHSSWIVSRPDHGVVGPRRVRPAAARVRRVVHAAAAGSSGKTVSSATTIANNSTFSKSTTTSRDIDEATTTTKKQKSNIVGRRPRGRSRRRRRTSTSHGTGGGGDDEEDEEVDDEYEGEVVYERDEGDDDVAMLERLGIYTADDDAAADSVLAGRDAVILEAAVEKNNYAATATATAENEEGEEMNFFQRRWQTLSPRLRGLVMLNLLMAGFGSNIVFLKSVGETVDPVVFSSCRFGLAALVFSPFLRGALKPDSDPRILRGGVELGVWAGLGYLTQNLGLVGCEASHASVMSSFTVIAVPVIACFAGRVVPKKTWAATVGALLGLAVMEGVLDLPAMMTAAGAAGAGVSQATAVDIDDEARISLAYILASALFFGVHIFRTDVIFGDEEDDEACAAVLPGEEEGVLEASTSMVSADGEEAAAAEAEAAPAMLMTPQQSMSLVAVQLTVVAAICTTLAAVTNADGLAQFLVGGAAGDGAGGEGAPDAATLWATVVYCGVVTTAGCLYFEAGVASTFTSSRIIHDDEPS